jgi:GNAT superfamily N-acetyltransferase
MSHMNKESVIRPIRVEEMSEAKRLIYTVAHELMEPQMSLEEVTAQWDAWGAFCDLDNVQKSYFENGGVFLVTVDGGQLVGTGAFQHYAEGECELRRIALLPAYRRQGLGYAMMMELLHRARAMGYGKMCLWTNRYKLSRAVAFYHQLGFVDVPHEGADKEELWMEMEINPSV